MIIPPFFPAPNVERLALVVIVTVGIAGLAVSSRRSWMII